MSEQQINITEWNNKSIELYLLLVSRYPTTTESLTKIIHRNAEDCVQRVI